MSNKKLTDSEIVKALEICGTYKGKCTDCPAYVKVDRSNCKQVLLGAIDLINRQKAENERLQATIDSFTDIGKLYSEIKAEAYKEFARLLRQQAFDRLYVSVDEINKLLKELVGENNAS